MSGLTFCTDSSKAKFNMHFQRGSVVEPLPNAEEAGLSPQEEDESRRIADSIDRTEVASSLTMARIRLARMSSSPNEVPPRPLEVVEV